MPELPDPLWTPPRHHEDGIEPRPEREPLGPWVKAACGCIWRESRPDGAAIKMDPTTPRACHNHRADHPASVGSSPQGMAMVPVTYHHTRPATD